MALSLLSLGPGKLTALLSANVNVLSAFRRSPPAGNTLMYHWAESGNTLTSHWGGTRKRERKGHCGKWKVELLI